MATILPVSWITILENVEKALAQAHENAARLATDEAEAIQSPSEAALEETLGKLAAHVDQEQGGFAGVSEKAAEADALLQISEETLRSWLAKAGTLRRKLATPAEHSL